VDWGNFYFLCGSSAAGLTGLMFIVVTFGSQYIREDNQDQVRVFMSPIVFHFMEVFLLCCIASIPTVDDWTLGWVVLIAGVFRLLFMPKALMVMLRSSKGNLDIDWEDWFLNIVVPTFLYLGLVLDSILYFMESDYADSLLAIIVIARLMTGMKSAWSLVIWVASKTESKEAKLQKTSGPSGS